MYVVEHCQDHLGIAKCKSCMQGEEFTEGGNGLKECLPCTTCREDQQQVSPCTPQRDTVCECRAGAFCAPEQTCEVCRKCKTHCPDGQIVKNCTPTSDTVCGKTKTEAAATQMGEGTLAAVVLGSLFVVSLMLGLVMYFFKKQQLNGIFWKINGCVHRKDSTDSENETIQKESSEVVNIIPCAEGTTLDTSSHATDSDNEQAQTERVTLLQYRPEASAEQRARHFAEHHCHGKNLAILPIDQGDDSLGQNGLTCPSDSASTFTIDPHCNCGTVGSETRGADSTENSSQNTHRASSSVPDKDSVTARHHRDKESKDKEDLRHHFMMFIEEVPIKRWKQFMRKLSLTENDIEAAYKDNSNDTQEAHYQMLNIWLQKTGKVASIEILLNTLREMDLNDTVHNIMEKTNNEMKHEA
ncbi:tumor necrosis factor receptor superfamily member 1A-like isoform X2 [Pristis pectinata]|nr:tumor necrosis factor receptor superfamily member 1A-like isoform X2 [Pristis pectinata]